MTATRTTDVAATAALVRTLAGSGADLVRIAVDSRRDAAALAEIRDTTDANLSVDLQENYRLVELVAPSVDKIRYNPGHLYHHEPEVPWREKVRFIADVAAEHDCALRVGVNSGSVDPAKRERYDAADALSPMLDSALEHCELLDAIGFTRYCVSLKGSDPDRVVQLNRRFADRRPDVPLHLGVTEAGMPPAGIRKTRQALIPLLARGIGDTLRVSLTVPNDRKVEEIAAGRQIADDVAAGRTDLGDADLPQGINIVSCPSCSRVQNEAFIELAEQVARLTRHVRRPDLTIAVMGCRVNGPGETDDADLGLWCGPTRVNLKRGERLLGSFTYEEILDRVRRELDALLV